MPERITYVSHGIDVKVFTNFVWLEFYLSKNSSSSMLITGGGGVVVRLDGNLSKYFENLPNDFNLFCCFGEGRKSKVGWLLRKASVSFTKKNHSWFTIQISFMRLEPRARAEG